MGPSTDKCWEDAKLEIENYLHANIVCNELSLLRNYCTKTHNDCHHSRREPCQKFCSCGHSKVLIDDLWNEDDFVKLTNECCTKSLVTSYNSKGGLWSTFQTTIPSRIKQNSWPWMVFTFYTFFIIF